VWCATSIPLLAVPVSLIGTFAVMAAMGLSLNTLSLIGLVLAIGIVVDDAIVVVENVERHIALGLSARYATRKAMDEVVGPIIATALVLVAVFLPTVFISGVSGAFYKQFALTIAVAYTGSGSAGDAHPSWTLKASSMRTPTPAFRFRAAPASPTSPRCSPGSMISTSEPATRICTPMPLLKSSRSVSLR
jgi:hypothetical protein